MTNEKIRCSIDQIMFRGAAIAGCPLPQTEYFANYIADELIIFIKEFGYGILTESEVLLALRLNSKGGLRYPSGIEIEQVQFVGSCFNVDFVSKVLYNYRTIRNQLDRRFENQLDGY